MFRENAIARIFKRETQHVELSSPGRQLAFRKTTKGRASNSRNLFNGRTQQELGTLISKVISRAFVPTGLLCVAALSGPVTARPSSTINYSALAGTWETTDKNGDAVGMTVEITLEPNSHDERHEGSRDYELGIGLYRRAAHAEKGLYSTNYFATSRHGGARWSGNRLRINEGSKKDLKSFGLDLTWDQAELRWIGRFHLRDFDKTVILERSRTDKPDLFVGTWIAADRSTYVHIEQQQDGVFTAWSDDQKADESAIRSYGVPASAKKLSSDRMLVTLWAYKSACCFHPFEARISADGQTLFSDWLKGPNQVAQQTAFNKISGTP